MKFTLLDQEGAVSKEWLYPTPQPVVQAGLIETCMSDGTRHRRYGEIRVELDGTATFAQQGPTYVLPPESDEVK